MFVSVLDLFKIGIGPSSSHTMGPLSAAAHFRAQVSGYFMAISSSMANTASVCGVESNSVYRIRCTLKGSLAYTGRGHGSDRAVTLGLHGYTFESLVNEDIDALMKGLNGRHSIDLQSSEQILFDPLQDIEFDLGDPFAEHPNGMRFDLVVESAKGYSVVDGCSQTYFSIGGGFIRMAEEMASVSAPLNTRSSDHYPFPFNSATEMVDMAEEQQTTIGAIKMANERVHFPAQQLVSGLNSIWSAMERCLERGLQANGTLPGGLSIERRAKALYESLKTDLKKSSNDTRDSNDSNSSKSVTMNDWLCAYAMAVNEENAAGHMVVTAPTNGAAGVIPAVLYYYVHHQKGALEDVYQFLLTASAIGSLIKQHSSISGAEVGCQGEVGSAAAMAAAGLCAVMGGSPAQVENAAEIALEHHLGMTCDPVKGLVQVPCIERNGFGAIKAYAAASLAMRGTGKHFMSLDNCIKAMRETGQEMSVKFKETSLGGLAVNFTEC